MWSMLLVQAGVILGENWVEIREMLQPFDLAIAVACVLAAAGQLVGCLPFVAFAFGSRHGGTPAAEPAA